MLTHVLDTSAWLIHVFKEPGSDQITTLFQNEDNRVAISAVSLIEVYSRLKSIDRATEFNPTAEQYKYLFHEILPATEEIAFRAVTIRRAATERLPSIDSIIAATAAHHGAILVHRDPQFLSIPEDQLTQEILAVEK